MARAAVTSLMTIANTVRWDRYSLLRTVRWWTVANTRSTGLAVWMCCQCSAASRRSYVRKWVTVCEATESSPSPFPRGPEPSAAAPEPARPLSGSSAPGCGRDAPDVDDPSPSWSLEPVLPARILYRLERPHEATEPSELIRPFPLLDVPQVAKVG